MQQKIPAIAIVFLLVGVELGQASCHPPLSRESVIIRHYSCGFLGLFDCHDYGYRVVRTEETSDLGPVVTDSGYQVRYHPYGRTVTEIQDQNGNVLRTESIVPGPVFRYPCDIINSQTGTAAQDLGYQLKIYSKVDPFLPKPPYFLPILIPQGIDPKYGTSRQFNFTRFQRELDSGLTIDATGQKATIDTVLKGTLRSLYEDGYDVALMLFKNPNIAIEQNARVFTRAWQFFQSKARNLYTKEPVIVAPSLGGIVARYSFQRTGLYYGESYLNASLPDCRLLVLLDAPNRGADIPMSLQTFVKYMHTKSDEARALLRVLESPAGQQLLIKTPLSRSSETANHTITDYEDTNTVHGKFYRKLNEPSFVAQAKKITSNGLGENPSCVAQDTVFCPKVPVHIAGITSGSDQTWGGLPYTQGLLYASLDRPTLDLRLYTSQTASLSRVFYGDYWTLDPWTYNFREPVFVEGVTGGLRDSYKEVKEAVEKEYDSWNIFQPGVEFHPFIPTISAMGLVQNTNINSPSAYIVPRVSPNPRTVENDPTTIANSVFDEIYVPRANQIHAALTIDPAEPTNPSRGSRSYLRNGLIAIFLVSETPL